MIICHLPDGKPCILPVILGETIREYCLRLMKATKTEPYADTCWYNLYDSKGLINRADNRHELLSKYTRDKIFRATLWHDGRLETLSLARGNIREDDFMPDLKTCAICLEDYTEDPLLFTGKTMTFLECGHRFHMGCIAKSSSDLCSLCRSPIESHMLRRLREDFGENSTRLIGAQIAE